MRSLDNIKYSTYDARTPVMVNFLNFWLEPRNRKSQSWTANRDINSVMLSTSLAPDGYLEL